MYGIIIKILFAFEFSVCDSSIGGFIWCDGLPPFNWAKIFGSISYGSSIDRAFAL